MTDMLKEMGSRIRLTRESRGMSQSELGIMAGYSAQSARSMISYIESGKRDIPASKLAMIADALHVTPTYLLGMEHGDQTFIGEKLTAEQREALEEFIKVVKGGAV